jgi:DNA polymerase III delta prime subunit
MALENSGRADKFGNRYEDLWLVSKYLDLCEEKILGVTVEPIGNLEDGVDIWCRNHDTSLTLYQCKSRNAHKEYWSIADLKARGLLSKAKKHILKNPSNRYTLVSAIGSIAVNDLSLRARNTNGINKDLLEFQVKNSNKVIKQFEEIASALELDYENEVELDLIITIIRNMEVFQFGDTYESRKQLKDRIDYLFVGETEQIYSMLTTYAVSNDKLGVEITELDLRTYLSEQEIIYRDYLKDKNIAIALERLNDEFNRSFKPINNVFINREVVEECVDKVENGKSFIIHGNAGRGKSGCVYGILDEFRSKGYVCLPIKLDRHIPKDNLIRFSNDLGFPTFITDCIEGISKEKKAVIILDQLDALRWSVAHSNEAIDICLDIEKRIDRINKYREDKISLIMVCRTFDLKNDVQIKELINGDGNESWLEFEIDCLSEEQLQEVVGNEFDTLDNKSKQLLMIPSNLYIWTKLEKKDINLKTTKDLIDAWWQEICKKSEESGFAYNEVNTIKNKLIKEINSRNSLMIPKILFSSINPNVIAMLASQGMLIEENSKIGFVHQSFYDSFLVDAMLTCVYSGGDIVKYLGDKKKQIPSKRYQLQLLFEILLVQDIHELAKIGIYILESEKIRFYLKYVYLQVLGTSNIFNDDLIRVIDMFLKEDRWSEHIYDAVFTGNAAVISHYIKRGHFDDWMGSERSARFFGFIRSSDIITNKVILDFLYKHAFVDEKLDSEIHFAIDRDIEHDSDELFEFRCKLLIKYPKLILNIYSWSELIKKRVDRAVDLIQIAIRSDIDPTKSNNFHISEKSYSDFLEGIESEAKRVLCEFSDYIYENTKSIDKYIYWEPEMSKWTSDKYDSNIFNRLYVDLCIQSAKKLLIKEEKLVLEKILGRTGLGTTVVFNEIALEVLKALPKEYSDFAIGWLCENPQKRLFNYTGRNIDYLHTVGEVLEIHSKTCSDDAFNRISEVIYYYKPTDMKERAESRFKANHQDRVNGNMILRQWCYWGTVQFRLIPKLDVLRVSSKVRALHMILVRREYNGDLIFKRSVVTSGFVTSTLQSAVNKLTVNNWIDIITNKKSLDQNRKRRDFGAFRESSPEMFARDLLEAGKQDSKLVNELIMSLDSDIEDVYVSTLYDLMAENAYVENQFEPIERNYMETAFRKFGIDRGYNVTISFCRILKRRREIKWSEDIYKYLNEIAINHEHPMENEYPVKPMDESKMEEISNLETCAINSARGCAAGAISNLIFEDYELFNTFKASIESLMHDKNLAVSMASIECIIATYNIDKSISIQWLIEISRRDIRLMGYRRVYNFIYSIYEEASEDINNIIKKMIESNYEEIREMGARHISNLIILGLKDKDELEIFDSFTYEQKKTGIDVAVRLFDRVNLRDNCKEVIIRLLNLDSEDYSSTLSHVFYEPEKISVDDINFVIFVLERLTNRVIIKGFIDYLSRNINVCLGRETEISNMINRIVQKNKVNMNDYSFNEIVQQLSKLVIFLFDRLGDDTSGMWLDIWDHMYENRMGNIRALSDELINH